MVSEGVACNSPSPGGAPGPLSLAVATLGWFAQPRSRRRTASESEFRPFAGLGAHGVGLGAPKNPARGRGLKLLDSDAGTSAEPRGDRAWERCATAREGEREREREERERGREREREREKERERMRERKERERKREKEREREREIEKKKGRER